MEFMSSTEKDRLICELEKTFGEWIRNIRLISEYPIPCKAAYELIDYQSEKKGVRFILNDEDESFMVCADFYPAMEHESEVEMIGTTNTGVELVLPYVTAEGMETIFNAYALGRTEGLRCLYWEKYMEHAAIRLEETPYIKEDELALELCKIGHAEKKMYKRIGAYSELKPYVGNILENLPLLRGIATDAIRRRNRTSRR